MTTTISAEWRKALEQKSNDELVIMLANATRTLGECLGHLKAERNEQAANAYRLILTERKATIPDDATLSKLGTFNGEGSA